MNLGILEQSRSGRATTEETLEFFDSLEPISLDFMLGSWKGESFPTNHPLDGSLEAYHWHGKRFESQEDVHPLVFSTANGNLISLNPAFMGPGLSLVDRVPVPKHPFIGRLFQAMMPLLATSHSKARLRMTVHREKCSATMIYDQLPINDAFRKIDEDTVLGIMDFKGMKRPFFFILHRI